MNIRRTALVLNFYLLAWTRKHWWSHLWRCEGNMQQFWWIGFSQHLTCAIANNCYLHLQEEVGIFCRRAGGNPALKIQQLSSLLSRAGKYPLKCSTWGNPASLHPCRKTAAASGDVMTIHWCLCCLIVSARAALQFQQPQVRMTLLRKTSMKAPKSTFILYYHAAL